MNFIINPRDNSDASGYEMRSWADKVIAAMVVLSAAAVAVRLVSRRIRHQKLWWDDWLCIISMFWSFGIAAIILAEMRLNGMGYPQHTLDASRVTQLIQVFTVGEVVYGCNTALTKIAVLLLYYRLLQVAFQTSRLLRVVAYTIAVLVILFALVFIFSIIFECIPVQKKWAPEIPGHCVKQEIPWILNAVLTILTDVAILVLPIPQIWRMRLGVLEKIGVTLIFALGWVVTFISIYRLHLLLSFPNDDFTYNILPIVIWSYTEIAVGIVSACLPISKPAVLWTTHKIGLTGQNGCLSQQLGSIKSWYESRSSSGGKSAGGGGGAGTGGATETTEQSQSGITPSGPGGGGGGGGGGPGGEGVQGGFQGKEGGSNAFSRYLWSEDASVSHSAAGQESPRSLESGVGGSRVVELRNL